MKNYLLLAGAAVLVAATAGCGPRLAEAQLSEKEQMWAAYIQENYSAWEKPETLPPGVVPSVKEEQGGQSATSTPMPPAVDEVEVVEVDDDGSMAVVNEEEVVLSNPMPYDTYVVIAGDSLSKIAQKIYKNGNLWKKIADANKDILPNPSKLKVGTELKIPHL